MFPCVLLVTVRFKWLLSETRGWTGSSQASLFSGPSASRSRLHHDTKEREFSFPVFLTTFLMLDLGTSTLVTVSMVGFRAQVMFCFVPWSSLNCRVVIGFPQRGEKFHMDSVGITWHLISWPPTSSSSHHFQPLSSLTTCDYSHVSCHGTEMCLSCYHNEVR